MFFHSKRRRPPPPRRRCSSLLHVSDTPHQGTSPVGSNGRESQVQTYAPSYTLSAQETGHPLSTSAASSYPNHHHFPLECHQHDSVPKTNDRRNRLANNPIDIRHRVDRHRLLAALPLSKRRSKKATTPQWTPVPSLARGERWSE